MTTAESVQAALEAIWARLDAVELEPALDRRGDARLREAATELWWRFEQDVAAHSATLNREISDEAEQIAYQIALSSCAGALSGLFWLGADDVKAREVRRRAKALSPNGEARSLLEDADRDPQAFATLLHAQWLMRRGDVVSARKFAGSVTDRSDLGELSRCAREIVDAPDPIRSAPTMYTLNGFGTSLYGRRDERSDGSYVATRYAVALFVPVFPIDAYRVTPRAEGGWYFHGKVALGPRARIWRKLTAVGAVLAALSGGALWYTTSDGYKLGRSIAEASQAETRARDPKSTADALARYERIFDDYYEKVSDPDLEPVSLGIGRLSMQNVPERITPAHVDDALHALRRFASLPEGTRGGAAAQWMTARVESLVKSLGTSDLEQLTSALRLANSGVVALGSSASVLVVRQHALRLALGKQLEGDWPVSAAEVYACAGDEPASAAALEKVLAALSAGSIDALTPEQEDWILRGHRDPRFRPAGQLLARVQERLAEQRADAERNRLLESGSPEELERAQAAHPDDPAYTIALASKQRSEGQSQAALDRLDKLGPVGSAPRAAARLRAAVMSDLGRAQDAERLYEHLLLVRLPAFEATSFQLDRLIASKQRELWRKAEQGNIPSEISGEIDKAKDQDEARAIFQKWVHGKLDDDPGIQALRARLEKLPDVVPAAVALGTVRLELASSATGKDKEALLSKAERTFLSIRGDAAGLPAFHLGLGTVYHRLGKTDAGDQEFKALLDRDDPGLELEVARHYRDLGLKTKARAVAETVHARGQESSVKQAAQLLSLLADTLDEREKWLLRGDQADEYTRTSLLEVQADKAFAAGKLVEADRKYEQVYLAHVKRAKTDSSGANNAALALSSRYACTGDDKHLTQAVDLLEQARRLAPDAAIVLQNMVVPLAHLAKLQALHRWLDTPALRLTSSDASDVVNWLAYGEHREALLTALRQGPEFRRARDVNRQARVLGPSWTDPLSFELNWLSLMQDEPGLRALKQQVADSTKLDRGEIQRAKAEWLSGRRDTQYREGLEGSFNRYERSLATLHGPQAVASRGVLLGLMAENREQLAQLDGAIEPARKAVPLWRDALAAWPALGAHRELAGALIRVAMLSVVAQDRSIPDAKQALRRDGLTLTLARWMDHPDKSPLSALKAQPEFGQALQTFVAAPDIQLSAFTYLLAELAGNSELLERARKQVEREHALLSMEIASALTATDDDQLHLKLLQRIAKTEPQRSAAK